METPSQPPSSRRGIASLARQEREYAAPRAEEKGGTASGNFKVRTRASPRSSSTMACAASPFTRARVPRPKQAKMRPYLRVGGFGEPEPCVSVADCLAEVAEVGEAEDQLNAPEDRPQSQNPTLPSPYP